MGKCPYCDQVLLELRGDVVAVRGHGDAPHMTDVLVISCANCLKMLGFIPR